MKNPIIVISEEMNQAEYDSLLELDETVEVLPGLEVAALSLQGAVDLLILDCGESSEDGIKSVIRIKKDWPGVPIIFITAESSEEIVLNAFKAGVREYVKKPLSASALKEVVADVLRLKRISREGEASAKEDMVPGVSRPVTVGLPDRLNRVVIYIENNYAKELNLDKLARIACLSKFHFSRTFKLSVGMNSIEFIAYVRVERAKQFLAKPGVSVDAVTFKVGFNDTSSFIKKFKKFTGFTPHAYKSLLIKNTRI